MKLSQFEHTLAHPFELENSKQTANKLILHAPKMKHIALVAPLKQILMISLPQPKTETTQDKWERKDQEAKLAFEKANESPVPEKEKISKEMRENHQAIAILTMVQTYNKNDFKFYHTVCDNFKKLFLSSGITYIDGVTPFCGEKYFEQLSFEDFETVMGRYLSFFLMSSITQMISPQT